MVSEIVLYKFFLIDTDYTSLYKGSLYVLVIRNFFLENNIF